MARISGEIEKEVHSNKKKAITKLLNNVLGDTINKSNREYLESGNSLCFQITEIDYIKLQLQYSIPMESAQIVTQVPFRGSNYQCIDSRWSFDISFVNYYCCYVNTLPEDYSFRFMIFLKKDLRFSENRKIFNSGYIGIFEVLV